MCAVVDTNVLVYDTFDDSAFHEEARALLGEWLIPAIVVYEYVWLIREFEVALDDVVRKVREYILSAPRQSSYSRDPRRSRPLCRS